MKEMTKGIIALTIILVVVSGVFIYEKIETGVLRKGDFGELGYIGYYENKTVFSSSFKENVSYNISFETTKYNLTALKLYVGEDIPDEYPEGWVYGDLDEINGLKII